MLTNEKIKSFISFDRSVDLLYDLSEDPYPAKLFGFNHSSLEKKELDTTYFGYVAEGTIELKNEAGSFLLKKGMYFSSPKEINISGEGRGFVLAQNNYNGFFHIGGPVEEKGRLQYIDGCTDSLLISPPIMGDPCLNLLHIPKGTFQSQHTHPSFRIGMIISGYGQCICPEQSYDLHPGLTFLIPTDGLHSFKTDAEDLRVIAYHPDSDFGPTHEDHPMINRTIL